MSDFTKGEWKAAPDDLRTAEHSADMAEFGATPSEIPIYSVTAWRGVGGHYVAEVGCHSESKANAHLISAAPEMFEALKSILDDLPTHRDWLNPDIERMGHEAIKKAEGKV
jgi:hypothetical protein